MTRHRKAAAIAMASSVFLLASLAVAWAFTPAATSFRSSPRSAGPAQKVTASGQNFAAPVEIHGI